MKLNFESYEVKINVSIDYKWLCLSRKIFEKNIEKSTIFSSDYATRGFDMTLIPWCDWCRIKVSKKLNSAATQQVENKLNTTKENGVQIKAFYNVFRYRFDY
jgi:hypothetical protein